MTQNAVTTPTTTPSPLSQLIPPVFLFAPAEPIPPIYARARVVFAALAFACTAKVVERVLKYDSDQFYEDSKHLNGALIAIVTMVFFSQVFLHLRNR